MHVASLELCKELYRLSEWNDTYLAWFIDRTHDEFYREPEVGRWTGSAKSEIFNQKPAYEKIAAL